jgi:DNA-binding CsgD family transcriptional regulator
MDGSSQPKKEGAITMGVEVLSLADVKASLTLTARVYGEAASFAERSQIVLREFLTLFDLKLVTLALITPTRATPTGLASVEVTEGSHAGELTEAEQTAMLRYFADIHSNPDPAHTAMCELLLRDPAACGAFAHHQLVDDAGPAWLSHRNAIRAPGNVGAELFIATPTTQRGLWGGITLHRPLHAPLFSSRDIALASVLAPAMQPMFDGRIAERKAHTIIEALTPRMRDSLAGVMRGGSEKTIAQDLGVSKHTIHEHMKRLHVAFGVSTRTELLAQVRRLGITPEMVTQAAGPKPLPMGKKAQAALARASQAAKASRTSTRRRTR